MNNIFLLALNTIKITFRKKRSYIVYLVLPIAVILISMSMYTNSGSGTINVGIVDKDNSKLSIDMINSIKSKDKYKVSIIDEGVVKDMVSSRKLDCVVQIPSSFDESIYEGTLKNIDVISIKGEVTTVWIKNYLDSYLNNLMGISEAANGNRELFNKIYTGSKSNGLKLETLEVQDNIMNKEVTVQSLGFLILFILTAAFNVSRLILIERKNRTFFRICSAPVSARSYIMGNILSSMAVIFVQVILVIFFIYKVFKIETYVAPVELMLILLSVGFAAVGLGILIVSLSDTTNQVNTMSTLIITPTCMLGGCFWPISIMPSYLRKISDFIPQKWAMDAIDKIQTGGSLNDIFANIGILIGFGLAFFIIAAYRFSRKDNVKNFV